MHQNCYDKHASTLTKLNSENLIINYSIMQQNPV